MINKLKQQQIQTNKFYINMVSFTVKLTLTIMQTTLSLFPITLHILGIYLLHQPNTFHENQRLYLTNLSFAELLFLLPLNILPYLRILETSVTLYDYIALFAICGFAVPWLTMTIALTIDRFMQVYLNIKYDLYVTKKITTQVVIGSWLIGLGCLSSTAFAKYKYEFDSLRFTHIVILQLYNGGIIISFVATYTYIYKKIKRIRCLDTAVVNKLNVNSGGGGGRKSRFIPYWIVITYIVFIMLPQSTNFILFQIIKIHHSKTTMFVITTFFFDLGSLFNVLVYILMNASLRMRFIAMIHWNSAKAKFNSANHAIYTTTIRVNCQVLHHWRNCVLPRYHCCHGHSGSTEKP